MKRKRKSETGDKNYPIWLLVNPKHPAIRHYIWTPILVVIQDKVYKELYTIIDTTNIYIRYAVSDSKLVPSTINGWGSDIANEIMSLRKLVLEYKPKIIISFGAFAFEFLRRIPEVKPDKGINYEGALNLGYEFERSIVDFDINQTNRIPLLRRLSESGSFVEGRNHFCREDDDVSDVDNYFHYVGTMIAEKIIENKDRFNILME